MPREPVTVSDRVVVAVARETNADPLELPPLYDVVDGDSLDACVEQMDEGSLAFSYAGVTVTVFSSGTVQVTDAAPDATTGETDVNTKPIGE